MSTIRLHNIFCIIATLCLIAFSVQSQAAPKGKAKPPQQIQKERLVLMPLRLGEADQQLQGAMEMALVKGLQQRYEVFFGEQVAKKAREIFLKESRNTAKKECDETRCLQGIAEAFQAELLATANITKQDGGYFIALSVQNLFDNKVVQSESVACKGCDSFAVIDKLKELIGAPVGAAAEKLHQKRETLEESQKIDQDPVMVRIPGKNYELGKYEVTQKEWQAVMGNNPSTFTSCGDNCPVEQVSWDDIQVFLQKLNVRTGRQYRLPTEAEWEYACYGGDQTEYCGSNDINEVAWYSENSNRTTHPIGQKKANGFGLYDMSGNVWEWMQDEFDGGRALRGGAWYFKPEVTRASYRFAFIPALGGHNFGFRLARTLP